MSRLFSFALVFAGCWPERVTGVAVPLDDAYFSNVKDASEAGSAADGIAEPFAVYKGERVKVVGLVKGVSGQEPWPVDMDVRIPDKDAPGGMAGQGKLLLDQPGPFELTVPKSLGKLELQAFSDPDADGPGATDPFGSVTIEVGETDLLEVQIQLVTGGRNAAGAGGPGHNDAPPGAPGGDPSAGAHTAVVPQGGVAGTPTPVPHGEGAANPPVVPHGPGKPADPPKAAPPGPGIRKPWKNLGPTPVTISGVLKGTDAQQIDLDIFQLDPSHRSGRKQLGKLRFAPGPFEFQAPADAGAIVLEAFADLQANGPSKGDPMGVYAKNPLMIGKTNISGVEIVLSPSATGHMPVFRAAPGAPPPPKR